MKKRRGSGQLEAADDVGGAPNESSNVYGSSFTSRFTMHHVLMLLSYTVWAAVSIYCLKSYNLKYGNDLMRFAYVTLVICVSNSVLGITEFFHEDLLYSLKTLLELLQILLALPCLTTEVWLKYKVAQKEVAWMHTIVGLLPTYIFLFQHYTRQDLVDLTVIMNVVSLAGVGFLYKDFFAMGAAGAVFLGICFLHHRNEVSFDLPPKQIFNYCMTAFTYCGYRAVM